MAYGPSTGQIGTTTYRDEGTAVPDQTKIIRLTNQLEKIAAGLDEVCGNVHNECNRIIGCEPTKVTPVDNAKMLSEPNCDLDRLERIVVLLDRKANDLHYAAARIQRI